MTSIQWYYTVRVQKEKDSDGLLCTVRSLVMVRESVTSAYDTKRGNGDKRELNLKWREFASLATNALDQLRLKIIVQVFIS